MKKSKGSDKLKLIMGDLILFNANIITMEPRLPKAQLIAVKNKKIHKVTTNEAIKDLKTSKTEWIDCKGKTVIPGMIDPHFHFMGFCESLVTLDLSPRNNIHSISDIQDKIRVFARTLPPGTWIRARGYNEFYLAEKRHPNRWDLDEATSLHPVRLTHRSGRAHVLNSLAMKLINISREMADPEGALIDRDVQTGEPTGLLYGMGEFLGKFIPPLEKEQLERGVKLANLNLCSSGITSIHDVSPRNNLDRLKMFNQWKEEGLLKPGISLSLGPEGFREYLSEPFRFKSLDETVPIRGVKIILHETTGQLSPGMEELKELLLEIHRSGFQAIIHAIEEKTIEAACDAIEVVLEKIPKPDHRHRLEHCSVCSPSLAKRIASLGITVVTQPSFIYYNGDRYLKTVPENDLKHLYPISTLIKNGVMIAGSSDCPVVPLNPIMGIYSAVSRKTEAGNYVLPEEKLSLYEALKIYTVNAARAIFEENIKGTIKPGKLADLVVLSGDPTELSPDELRDIQVEMTIIRGEIVWEKRD